MHHLLRAQLQYHLGKDFVPDGALREFLDTVSGYYVEVEREREGVASLHELAETTQRLRVQSELELANQHALLQRIIDSIPDLIYFKNQESVYLGCNKAFEEYFGVPQKEIAGRTDFDFVDVESAGQLRKMDMEVLASNEAYTNEEWVAYPDGRRVCLDTVKTPYVGADGTLLGLIGIGRDITERKHLEEALKMAAFAYDHCSESMMVTDLDNNIVAVNPAFFKITGYTEDEVIGKNPRILKSGLQDQSFYREMWQVLETDGHWQGEIWNRHKNGEIFPEWLRINRLCNDDGSVYRHVALFSDITEQKYAEEKLRQEKQFSDDIINTLPDIFYVLDEHGDYIRVNQKFLEVTGYTENDLSRMAVSGLFAGQEKERFAERFQEAFNVGRLDVEMLLITKWGGSMPYHFTGYRTMIYGKSYLVGLGRDISERKAYEQALMRQANVDSLTGLATRRHFMELVENELSRARRYGGPTSVIMLDLDEFKAINDRNGHHVGDMVLQMIGDICRHTLREIDIVGRVGGEEFAILLPDADEQQALKVAERLRQNIADAQLHLGQGGALHFTASIGVDTLNDDADIDTLLGKADHALYNAKRSGRNKVCTVDG